MKNPIRSAAIVINYNAVLLMYRQKIGKQYYTFPGGSIESNEEAKDAAIREVFEETMVEVDSPRLLYQLNIGDKKEFFFLCNYVSGKPFLNHQSEEYKRIMQDNYYEPMWVNINKLHEICLYPLEIRDFLITDIKRGFNFEFQTIEVSNLKQ